jgi:hypothetical protein
MSGPTHRYPDSHDLDVDFPLACVPWTPSQTPSSALPKRPGLASDEPYDSAHEDIAKYMRGKAWVWPRQDIFFYTDIHADVLAMRRSLHASGAVELDGPGDLDFKLTPRGRRGRFIFGGDTFDKGPSNLRLLRALARLVELGANVEFLCGNHDLRTYLGLYYFGAKEVPLAHLFVRMGPKCIPLFREVWDDYLDAGVLADVPSESAIRALIFPEPQWWQSFPLYARRRLSVAAIEKEVERIRYKVSKIEARALEMGMSLGMLYAAVRKARELFVDFGGAFAWYFERLKLVTRAGSLLFVHAGVCDESAKILCRIGTQGINTAFFHELKSDPFGLYNGILGNMIRTKYRATDRPFGESGAAALHRAGIYAIVHGHRNVTGGHRTILRNNVLNYECDASVDRNTRLLEGLDPRGGAAMIFRNDGIALGISTDHPAIKVHDFTNLCDFLTFAG